MADMLHNRANLLPYDAICTFVFKDYKDFAKFMCVQYMESCSDFISAFVLLEL